jgi:AcrR family transcriptional regulator
MVRGLSEASLQKQRDRALAAAVTLFEREGIEGVSLRGIANEVELSAMALYRYFPGGKSEVLATLRGRGFEQLAAVFDGALADVEGPIERIVALTIALVRFALRHPGLYRLMFEVTQPEEYEPYLAARRKLAWQQPGEAFRGAIRQGLLAGDPDQLPHLVFAAVHGLISFELSGQPQPQRRLNRSVAPLLTLLLRGANAGPAVLRKLRPLADPKLWVR